MLFGFSAFLIVFFMDSLPKMAPQKHKNAIMRKIRSHSTSWVMLHDRGFVLLSHEKVIYTSPPRTSLSLQSPNSYSGGEPVSIQSGTGCVHLTNQRVWVPAVPENHSTNKKNPKLLTDKGFLDSLPSPAVNTRISVILSASLEPS